MRHYKNHSNVWLCATALCLFSLSPGVAAAQTLTQNTPLRFGRVVMHDNGSARDLRLLPSGAYTADTGYYIIDQAPQLGSYTVENQAANAIMDVIITPTGTVQPSGGGPYFTLVDFFTVPALVSTDGNGNATFQVGATLRSSGIGNYASTTYDGGFTITVTPRP
jgi:hypothetical protein